MTDTGMKQCPKCQGEVAAGVVKCRHCGSRLEPMPLWTTGNMAAVFVVAVVFAVLGGTTDGSASGVIGAVGGVIALVSGFLLVRALLRRD